MLLNFKAELNHLKCQGYHTVRLQKALYHLMADQGRVANPVCKWLNLHTSCANGVLHTWQGLERIATAFVPANSERPLFFSPLSWPTRSVHIDTLLAASRVLWCAGVAIFFFALFSSTGPILMPPTAMRVFSLASHIRSIPKHTGVHSVGWTGLYQKLTRLIFC